MKRIMFVAPVLKYGGAEKNFIGVANFAAESDYEVFLLSEGNGSAMRYINPKIKQIELKTCSSSSFIKRYCHTIKSIRKEVVKNKIDLVVSFIEPWRSASIIATRFSKAKCVVSERADPYSRGGRHDGVIFKIFSLADGHVFQTEQARDFFGERVRRKSRVIPNPVFKEDAFQKYEGPKKDVIVSIARLDIKQKRQDILIKAFAKIESKFPNYKLLLYGNGPDEQKIKDLILELHLEDKAFLMGVTHDVYSALGESKIMVLTSDFEGIPNAIIESLCAGVPVVSTKCSPGGAELLINDNENGLLVERGDIAGVAEAITKILKDEALAEKFVNNGLSVKERFDFDLIMKKWISYFESVIQG